MVVVHNDIYVLLLFHTILTAVTQPV